METEQAKTELERRSKIAMAISNPDLPSTITASIRVPNDFSHTPFYCEENVYFLCKKLGMMGVANAEGTDLFVVFISNEKKQIPLWHQKASKRTDGMVLWDYHVICIQRSGEGTNLDQVWDLDSSLPIPVPLTCYTSEAIRPRSPLHPEYRRLFRVVHAPLFLHFFASDRRHMKDAQGNWIALLPPYESIVAQDGSVNNLDGYISMRKDDMGAKLEHLVEGVFSRKLGVVINETQLEDFFSTLKLIEVK